MPSGQVSMIDGVHLVPLKRIPTAGGEVMHAMKGSDAGFKGFGEAYFSTVDFGAVKAWKCHRLMTSNLVVPCGKVKFVLCRGLKDASDHVFHEIELSRQHYCRLTIPPLVWYGFQGLDKGLNLVLNLSDIEHDPKETDHLSVGSAEYKWGSIE